VTTFHAGGPALSTTVTTDTDTMCGPHRTENRRASGAFRSGSQYCHRRIVYKDASSPFAHDAPDRHARSRQPAPGGGRRRAARRRGRSYCRRYRSYCRGCIAPLTHTHRSCRLYRRSPLDGARFDDGPGIEPRYSPTSKHVTPHSTQHTSRGSRTTTTPMIRKQTPTDSTRRYRPQAQTANRYTRGGDR
jgi:hypothetical protein